MYLDGIDVDEPTTALKTPRFDYREKARNYVRPLLGKKKGPGPDCPRSCSPGSGGCSPTAVARAARRLLAVGEDEVLILVMAGGVNYNGI